MLRGEFGGGVLLTSCNHVSHFSCSNLSLIVRVAASAAAMVSAAGMIAVYVGKCL